MTEGATLAQVSGHLVFGHHDHDLFGRRSFVFPMELVEAPWTKGLIGICRKCGEKIQEADALPENPCVQAKAQAKKMLQEKGEWGAKRVILTDCLDICPEGKVSVMRVVPGQAVQVSTIDSLDLLGDLFQQ